MVPSNREKIMFRRGLQRAVLWDRNRNRNRNRNRKNHNFLPCGTGTVNCQKVGTGTVINYGSGTVIIWYHKSSHKAQYKIVYLISFIKNFFHSHFTINLLKPIIFFLVKSLEYKRLDFSKNIFWKLCFLWSRYGTRTVTWQKSEPEPEP